MGLPPLDNLVRIRQLKAEGATRTEIDGLLGSARARLKDAALTNLSLDSRFDLAYNAAERHGRRELPVSCEIKCSTSACEAR